MLKAFETALASFNRGDFSSAGEAFEKLIRQYPNQTEIVARCNTYLTVCRSRTRPVATDPKTADSLYDQGVLELNRGNFDEAIALFGRALEAQPGNPHVLYSLAAAQVRAGRVEEGLENLQAAVEAKGVFRSYARQDSDFFPVRSELRFQELVGSLYDFEVSR